MIPLVKLAKLSPNHRLRKAALILGGIERTFLASGDDRADCTTGELAGLVRYTLDLAALLVRDNGTPDTVREAAETLGKTDTTSLAAVLRAVDRLRHSLMSSTGQAPADWDLINPRTGRPDSGARPVVSGTRVYLEDLRSPFNVGAVFRTAEAFGFEEILLSPSCADPLHPRALRSSMGAVDLVPWKRVELEDVIGPQNSVYGEVFALELGGTPIEAFSFPRSGLMVLGSEELGVSPLARSFCRDRIVSIPLGGLKASLNAAVAFGIAAWAWVSAIKKDSEPISDGYF